MSSSTHATDSSESSHRRPASTLLSPPPDTSVQAVSSYTPINALLLLMEYNGSNLPPPDWLFARHGLPAIFRDSFDGTAWWTLEQKTAIKAALDRWASPTYDHPLHPCSGYILPASTRATPAIQRDNRQRHTLRYFIDRLHYTTSTAGLILEEVDVSTHPSTVPFRAGPAGLDLHHFDVLHHSGHCTLALIAGMRKTWTRPRVDTAGRSVWQLLVEGKKLWILARPEKKEAMGRHFHDERTVRWSQFDTEDKAWLVDNRCLMVHQRAGDVLYIPQGWSHMCTHLSDTLTLQSNLIHSWDFASALSGLDFRRLSEEEVALYRAAHAVAIDAIAGLRWGVTEVEAMWKRKMQERRAGEAERERAMKEAEAARAAAAVKAAAERAEQAKQRKRRKKGG